MSSMLSTGIILATVAHTKDSHSSASILHNVFKYLFYEYTFIYTFSIPFEYLRVHANRSKSLYNGLIFTRKCGYTPVDTNKYSG
jgi:hypothetical protein